MAAIGGASLGVLTGYQIMDQATGESKTISELFAGPAGAAGADGEDGVGITDIAAARSGDTVTLTFTMSDSTTKTASFDLPAA
ncbi:hypothetical protein ADU18_0117 [Cronobacter phage PBES 02]|uniref:Uncharacterized protein n=1 Tax=Cronobacter phage PBES 02 TaxID=1684115 RepID=A0A0K1YAA4_9CAUD|nr:hypothetical protein ADU18_0117 [Cronobacter phage PBES 02]AKY04017.1 hypothetical protein ADU18_0117 [Cronobacter phage PBES 02]